jgi:hypothetical protein
MTKIRNFFLAFAVLGATSAATVAPALAADWGHAPYARAHEWRFHDRRPVFYAGAPYAYPYAVPAPAYAPPPVFYAPPAAALSVTIPFHVR